MFLQFAFVTDVILQYVIIISIYDKLVIRFTSFSLNQC